MWSDDTKMYLEILLHEKWIEKCSRKQWQMLSLLHRLVHMLSLCQHILSLRQETHFQEIHFHHCSLDRFGLSLQSHQSHFGNYINITPRSWNNSMRESLSRLTAEAESGCLAQQVAMILSNPGWGILIRTILSYLECKHMLLPKPQTARESLLCCWVQRPGTVQSLTPTDGNCCCVQKDYFWRTTTLFTCLDFLS